uniref:Ig-like domain-containing protein n=1 Tax=Pipistrellus kuhlii TaxID=59472 RepID=A0A7J7QTR8_PIPKU|nr:hypothetical protein mPipKuh1_017062 [Pipistrellus kuhlii]
MLAGFLSLLLFGLCAGHDPRRDESLPRPSIQAWPSWVLPANSDVTLRCSTPIREVRFTFRKNNDALEISPSPDYPEGLAEFHLTDLKSSDAGEYTCEYYIIESPTIRSPPSDVLLLLVTGNFPKPSLHAHHRGEVTAGENVILQCQQPRNMMNSYMFALLKKGTSTPIKLQHAIGMETDFSLPSVTGRDTGDYSCVYFQPRAPFWASQPSDQLTISVADSPGATSTDYTSGNRAKSTDYTMGNIIRLCLSAVIMVLMVAFLLEVWCCQKWSPCGSRYNTELSSLSHGLL